MEVRAILDVWPVLTLFAVVLVTAFLYIIAFRHNHAVMVHDRIRESKKVRRQYDASLKEKQDSHA